MSSRKQAQSRLFKRYQKQQPSMHRQYAYVEIEGKMVKALDENGEEIYRDVPNRAMKRAMYAKQRRTSGP